MIWLDIHSLRRRLRRNFLVESRKSQLSSYLHFYSWDKNIIYHASSFNFIHQIMPLIAPTPRGSLWAESTYRSGPSLLNLLLRSLEQHDVGFLFSVLKINLSLFSTQKIDLGLFWISGAQNWQGSIFGAKNKLVYFRPVPKIDPVQFSGQYLYPIYQIYCRNNISFTSAIAYKNNPYQVTCDLGYIKKPLIGMSDL